MIQDIILASQSPRRKQLLEWAQISFEIITRGTDETYPDGLSIEDIPIHIAREKALAVKNYVKETFASTPKTEPIVAADTIVVLQNEVIGKPQDRDDAVRILSALSGRQHKVITGVVILYNEKEISFSDITEVEFHPLTQQQIEFYVDEYEPYDKAGAYAIQEWIGVIGIKKINGDFYNVMGLPVSRAIKALESLE